MKQISTCVSHLGTHDQHATQHTVEYKDCHLKNHSKPTFACICKPAVCASRTRISSTSTDSTLCYMYGMHSAYWETLVSTRQVQTG